MVSAVGVDGGALPADLPGERAQTGRPRLRVGRLPAGEQLHRDGPHQPEHHQKPRQGQPGRRGQQRRPQHQRPLHVQSPLRAGQRAAKANPRGQLTTDRHLNITDHL